MRVSHLRFDYASMRNMDLSGVLVRRSSWRESDLSGSDLGEQRYRGIYFIQLDSMAQILTLRA